MRRPTRQELRIQSDAGFELDWVGCDGSGWCDPGWCREHFHWCSPCAENYGDRVLDFQGYWGDSGMPEPRPCLGVSSGWSHGTQWESSCANSGHPLNIRGYSEAWSIRLDPLTP